MVGFNFLFRKFCRYLTTLRRYAQHRRYVNLRDIAFLKRNTGLLCFFVEPTWRVRLEKENFRVIYQMKAEMLNNLENKRPGIFEAIYLFEG